MNNQILDILADLYGIDPEFKKHEEQLIKIINELLESRPAAQIDDEFVKELRQRILSEAQAISGANRLETGIKFNFMHANKYAYALGGLGVLLLIIVPALLLSQFKTGPSLNVALSSGIKELSDNAFGEISAQTLSLNSAEGRGSADGAQISPKIAPLGMGGGEEMSSDMAMIMPEFINYNYIYKGDDFSINDPKMKVYRRSELGGGKEFAAILSQVNLDLMDISRFKDAKVTSISLNEEREFGYSVYLNFSDNSLSLYKNWNKWPQEEPVMYAEKQVAPSQSWTINDIPADNVLVGIADGFLKSYGINMSNYGPGEVQNSWRKYYEMAEDKANSYVPQEMSVIYPLIIEGKTVYDQGGNKTGLYVGVDAKLKKTSSVSQIKAHSFESSMYDVINDKEKIIDLALNRGNNNHWRKVDENAKKIDIELGTPELKLVNFWRHNMEKGIGEEIFIPSYIFPVVGSSDNSHYYSENVVVPLVQGLVDTMEYGIMPMPMIMEDSPVQGGASEASEGSAGAMNVPEDLSAGEVMINENLR
jgi:hypothetical protein